MNFSLTYLVGRFFYRIYDFFHHWYADASRVFFHKLVSFLESLDYAFALKITLRYFFQPLFKDYTVIGRIIGVVFRTCRILGSLAVYFLILVVFSIVYIFWLALPVVLILYVIGYSS